jgi:hypothetical protein
VKATAYGTIARIGQPAAERSASGRTIGAHAFKSVDLQLGSAMIDLDHNGQQAGEIVYCEVSEDGQIKLVGVIDNGDRLDQVGEPVYLSGLWEIRGGAAGNTYIAREAQLLAAALTLDPCTVAALPVRWLPGDIRRSVDRFTWPGSWRYNMPLLGRALARVEQFGSGQLEQRTATCIVDLAAEAENDRAQAEWEREQSRIETRSPVAKRAAEWQRHGPGSRIEWSRHPGRVLRVY